jgi:hypothetical protein
MFNIGRRPFNNKIMKDYCLKSTNDYIRKITEKKNLEINSDLNKFRQELVLCSSNPDDNNYNLFPFFIFLSISSFIYFFSNRK